MEVEVEKRKCQPKENGRGKWKNGRREVGVGATGRKWFWIDGHRKEEWKNLNPKVTMVCNTDTCDC